MILPLPDIQVAFPWRTTNDAGRPHEYRCRGNRLEEIHPGAAI